MKPSHLLHVAALLLTIPAGAGEVRAFKNDKGVEIRAEITGGTAEKVELKREDGKTFTVATTTLSTEDQEFIRKWMATHKVIKVSYQASIARSVAREHKSDGSVTKGNDCNYNVSIKNTGAAPITGLRVESIIYAPYGSPAATAFHRQELTAIAPGKSGATASARLFVPQKESIMKSGLSTVRRMSEGSPDGLYMELIIDGKTVGGFTMGTVPPTAGEDLKKWRSEQPAP